MSGCQRQGQGRLTRRYTPIRAKCSALVDGRRDACPWGCGRNRNGARVGGGGKPDDRASLGGLSNGSGWARLHRHHMRVNLAHASGVKKHEMEERTDSRRLKS